jgi:hypothetical protein
MQVYSSIDCGSYAIKLSVPPAGLARLEIQLHRCSLLSAKDGFATEHREQKSGRDGVFEIEASGAILRAAPRL